VIHEKQIADANRLILDFPDAGIQVLNGRYGPYVTDRQRNAKIPKDRDPKSLTLEECQTLLAAAPARTFGRWGRKNGQGKNGPGRKDPGRKDPGGKDKGGTAKGAGSKRPAGEAVAADAATVETAARLAAKSSKPAAKKRAPAKPRTRPQSRAAVRPQGLKRKKA
jgi:DNA topoisomerase I